MRPGIGLTLALVAGIFGIRIAIANVPRAAAVLPAPAVDERSAGVHQASTVLAGGCFWGVQAVFQHIKGVKTVVSGYAGGEINAPTYQLVSSGMTGHAEAVRITYDPTLVSYGTLLKVFFSVVHDPTQLNRQGPDRGTQYRSAIFYEGDEQRRVAESYVAQLTAAKAFDSPIVTQVAPLAGFHAAEDYHQNYATSHPYEPYILMNDAPKIRLLEKSEPQLWRPEIVSR